MADPAYNIEGVRREQGNPTYHQQSSNRAQEKVSNRVTPAGRFARYGPTNAPRVGRTLGQRQLGSMRREGLTPEDIQTVEQIQQELQEAYGKQGFSVGSAGGAAGTAPQPLRFPGPRLIPDLPLPDTATSALPTISAPPIPIPTLPTISAPALPNLPALPRLPQLPTFPWLIFLIAVVKDLIDIFTGGVISVIFSVLLGAAFVVWYYPKVNVIKKIVRGLKAKALKFIVKKVIKRLARRFVIFSILDAIPGLSIFMPISVLVLMIHFQHTKLVKIMKFGLAFHKEVGGKHSTAFRGLRGAPGTQSAQSTQAAGPRGGYRASPSAQRQAHNRMRRA